MIAQLLKTTLLALPVAGLLALAPVAFAYNYEDYDDESPHAPAPAQSPGSGHL